MAMAKNKGGGGWSKRRVSGREGAGGGKGLNPVAKKGKGQGGVQAWAQEEGGRMETE